MGFYDNADSVEKYIEMCSGYDGSNIYKVLQENVKNRSCLLELGSGPGFDIPFLSERYRVTGSDLSDEFLNRCRQIYPDIPFIKMDASKMDTMEKFDCIYSNKVLHHLTESQLAVSLNLQAERLTEGGIIAHSFWVGEGTQEIEGLLFTYYLQEKLKAIVSESFDVLKTLIYQELENSDSLLVIAKLKEIA